MQYRKFITFLKVELLRFLREPISLFFTLIFPILLIYIFGDIFGSASNNDTGATYYNSLVSIDIAFLVSNLTLMGVGNDLAVQKENGISEANELLPISSGFRLVVESISYLLILFTSIILICVYTYLTYPGISFKGSVILYALFIIISYYLFVSFVKFVVSLNYSARTLQLILSSIFFILLFVSGIVIPKDNLPEALRDFINFSPTYIIFSSLDSIWNNHLDFLKYITNSIIFILFTIILNVIVKFRK